LRKDNALRVGVLGVGGMEEEVLRVDRLEKSPQFMINHNLFRLCKTFRYSSHSRYAVR
jgi:hypothetical protein